MTADSQFSITLSNAAEDRIVELINQYPEKRSAIMPALYLAQNELGWVSPEAIKWVSERLELEGSKVLEVVTFYTMYYKKPVGDYHIQICQTLSCMLCGARKMVQDLAEKLEVSHGEITPCGTWSYEEVQCIGSCGTGPVVQINDVFFESISIEGLFELMDEIEKEKPNLRFRELDQRLADGLPRHPRSKIKMT